MESSNPLGHDIIKGKFNKLLSYFFFKLVCFFNQLFFLFDTLFLVLVLLLYFFLDFFKLLFMVTRHAPLLIVNFGQIYPAYSLIHQLPYVLKLSFLELFFWINETGSFCRKWIFNRVLLIKVT